MPEDRMYKTLPPIESAVDDWGEDWGDVTAPAQDIYDVLETNVTDILAAGEN